MNILVISPGIIADADINGNIIRQKMMLEALQRNGNKVILLMYAPFVGKKRKKSKISTRFKSYIFSINAKTIFLASLSKIFRFQFYPLACAYFEPFSKYKESVKRIIEDNRIDLIQCENVETAPSIQRFIKKIPVIITAHDVLIDRYREFFEYRRISRIVSKPILKWLEEMEIETLRKASYTVCLSKADEGRFLELGIPRGKLTTITAGLANTERFRPLPPDKNLQGKFGLTGKEPILFFGGADSIQNTKAVEDIARYIFPPLIEEFPDIRILFTGTVSRFIWRQRLEERFQGRIINVGFVNDLELYYSLVDIVILPITIGSGIRLKVAEAMAAGKAIISTKKGIMGYDLKNNKHLIIEDDLKLFPQHIEKLLKDRDLRKNLGAKAREFMLEFDWKIMMDGYQDIYQQVLGGRKVPESLTLEEIQI